MKKIQAILVTGVTSQIGVFLLPHLLERGLEVHAVSRRRQTLEGVQWYRSDIEHGELPRIAADCVIHLAPLNLLPPLLPKLNTGSLARLIAFGSTSRFSKQSSSDPDERAFALALAQAETGISAYCESHEIAWTVFRPTLIYGCGRDKNVTIIANFIRRFGFFPLIGKAGGLRQPVHAEDLALACVAVLDEPATYNRAYNLSGGETLSYRAMVERIFEAQGKRPRFLRIPLPLFQAAMEVASLWPPYRYLSGEMAKRMLEDLCFDHSEATSDFNFCPRKFDPKQWPSS